MPVATPLSLNNIVNEFGLGILSTDTYNSGSGSITAPGAAISVRIKLWGAGGGGGGGDTSTGGGGGGGGFVIKTMSVTGGSTSFNWSVGAGGSGGTFDSNGSSGGSSTITGGATLTAGGGGGGAGGTSGGAGGNGGSSTGGDTGSESGDPGINGNGGDAGGIFFGGGTGGDTTPNSGTAPGGGGGGAADGGGAPGASGRVVFEWLYKGLASFTRGSGEIPNHSANLNVPTTTTGLSILDFSGAERSFTATITNGTEGGYPFRYGYVSGSVGSINRAQVGRNRNNLNSYTIHSAVETVFYDFGTSQYYNYYYIYFSTNSPITDVTFFSNLSSGAYSFNRISASYPDGLFDSVNNLHYWEWFISNSALGDPFIAAGSTHNITLQYGGP